MIETKHGLRAAALAVFLVVTTAPRAGATETLRSFAWTEVEAEGNSLPGTIVEDRGQPTLRVTGSGASQTFALLRVSAPGLSSTRFALRGTVRYEGVSPAGYLEMWTVFGPTERYFSRTSAPQGPLGALDGTSPWRDFVLPFQLDETSPSRPIALELNLVLPGTGDVFLGPPSLVQYDPGESLLAGRADAGAWWSARTAGWVGGLGGTLLGLLGAVLGWLVSRGRAAGFVQALLLLVGTLGVLVFAVGLWALSHGQPYAVFYPLLLGGGLGAVLGGTLRSTIRKRYAALELRKMRALDAR